MSPLRATYYGKMKHSRAMLCSKPAIPVNNDDTATGVSLLGHINIVVRRSTIAQNTKDGSTAAENVLQNKVTSVGRRTYSSR